MPFEADIDEFAARFNACQIRAEEWTHLAHLAVGAWHVHHYGPVEALVRLRKGIRRLNESIGGTNTDTSGYHETITAAYVRLIAAFLDESPTHAPLSDRVRQLTTGPLADSKVLFMFYVKETLESTKARAKWVEPDLAPLSLDLLR